MFRLTNSPHLFPDFVVHVSATFDIGLAEEATSSERAAFGSILRNSVAQRRSEFYAGRRCARAAISICSPERAGAIVGVGNERQPVWPDGLVGSITHSGDYAAAAVARTVEVRGLGLDTEALIEDKVADEIGRDIATRSEIGIVHEALAVRAGVAFTVIFSAKESLFKCLFPIVNRRFDFVDAELIAVDQSSCELRLTTDLGAPYTAGTKLVARFVLEAGCVHTAVLI